METVTQADREEAASKIKDRFSQHRNASNEPERGDTPSQTEDHMDSITDIYGATLRGFRSEIERRRAAIAKSYRACPNPESDYAQVHRRVAAVLDECQVIVERRLLEAGSTIS